MIKRINVKYIILRDSKEYIYEFSIFDKQDASCIENLRLIIYCFHEKKSRDEPTQGWELYIEEQK